jgi:excinuclease ABC subunit A
LLPTSHSDLDAPWRDLSEKSRDIIINGSGKERIKFSWADE